VAKKIVVLGGGTGGTLLANRLRRLFGLTKADLIDQVKDIITVGEFYDMAAGGQIIFT
jgi:NADH dehydrogenase FAD-containing subunit